MADRTGIANAWAEDDLSAAQAEALDVAEAERARREFEEAILPDGSLLFDRDPDTGAVEKMRFDEMAGTVTIERVADVEPVVEWAKGRFNEGIVDRHSEMRHVARFAPEALDLWPAAYFGPNHGLPAQWYLKPEYHHLVMKAVHDPDMAKFRTLAGRFERRSERA